jgi:hypothetical protein
MENLHAADALLSELQSPVADELAADSQVAYFGFNNFIE